ncbi:RNA polymerase sigma factor [Candidatus Magnetominusculus xianensis]|uniref:RNA polymerase subunit sigma-24 n=1 Tax=Candidatus Magnetominusculus xianensis TaxID=1748249 RepID=A0ABR5SHK9_9BACT|nr:sigma-70 family RNA polymerase sigma factor [Candidatus Magnetominusculus xianensis]KWT91588.1 RNA polymerase subunit sigma-24 [Candidatus Magnetominusculus xianensis]MBF0404373.1 sigma-70 family RNA polymerase sigma factor [Nitrospirota bacterium]
MNRGENETANAVHDAESLAAGASRGDSDAFDRLVLMYKDKIYNLCYRFLGVHAEAEDAAQDVFMKVYTSINQFKFQASFSTWLYRIAVNTCKNRLKSYTWRNFFSFKAGITDEELPEITDSRPLPDMQMEKAQLTRAVEKAIAALPVAQRLVVVLRDIEGLSYEEISTITGFNPGTVKSKISRARQALRDKLQGVVG